MSDSISERKITRPSVEPSCYLHRAFRMRHQAHYVAPAIAYAGDIRERAVRIGRRVLAPVRRRVSKHNLFVSLQFGERRFVAIIISVAVRDRNLQHLAGGGRGGKRRVRGFHANVHLPADKSHPRVALQHAGEQTRFAKNLKTVADAENQASAAREFFHGAHHGRKSRNRARAQIIAVGKSAGQQDRVKAVYLFGLMPQEFNRLVENFAERVPGVVIAIRARKHHHTKFHRADSPLAQILSQREVRFPVPVEESKDSDPVAEILGMERRRVRRQKNVKLAQR